MRGINKVILVGTLTRDPESKTFAGGGSLCQFSVATNESWIDKNTGEKKESSEFHRIVIQNKLGEIAQQYLRKGSKVYIEGSLRTRQWTDQSGIEKYTTEVRGLSMQMLDSKGDSQSQQNQAQPQQSGYVQRPQQQPQNQQQGGYSQQQPQQGYQPKNGDDLDSDLPF